MNKTISNAHGFSPDFVIFGKNSNNPLNVDNNNSIDVKDYTQQIVKKLQKTNSKVNENLRKYREKMKKQFGEKLKKIVRFNSGDKVFLKKDSDLVQKNLSSKLDNKAFGPFQINKVYSEKGNVEIQIAPNSTLIVKSNNLRLANDQQIDLSELYKSDETKPIILKPSKLNEIIILKEVEKFPKPENDGKGYIPKKSEFTPETLVGKRIEEYWTSGNRKNTWFRGTVVGYTNNMAKCLIYYDDRTDDVDPAIDYYAEPLLTDKRIKWRMLT